MSNNMTDFETIYADWTDNRRDGERVARLLDATYDYLHDGATLDGTQLAGVLALINNRLAFRDALIIAALRPDRVDSFFMGQCVFFPHLSDSVKQMEDLLDTSFNTGAGWDETIACRLDQLMQDCMALLDGQSDKRCAQPLAVRAYMAWWAGWQGAWKMACDATVIDEKCSLARLVVQGLLSGKQPAVAMRG